MSKAKRKFAPLNQSSQGEERVGLPFSKRCGTETSASGRKQLLKEEIEMADGSGLMIERSQATHHASRSLVARQFSEYLGSRAKREAPNLTDREADVVDNEGDRIIKRLARSSSQDADDIILKVRVAMREGVDCIQSGWLFASIERDLERLAAE